MSGKILLTGANGYIGGRLAQTLSDEGLNVRCMVRRPNEAKHRLPDNVEIVKADVLDATSLARATEGVHTAFYLIHSMGNSEDFEALDRRAATNFSNACQSAGVSRVIYLGGLGEQSDPLSAHLRSRQEVGRILRDSGIDTIEFRTSIVIGSGSLSFEMVRTLTEKLPIMITPKWVHVKAQPIGIEDLIAYLVAAIELPQANSRVVEIGGKDVVSYADLMREYARQRKLKRIFVPVPFLTPTLSSLWLGLVTPLYARVGHKLITSIKNETVVRLSSGSREFGIQPIGMRAAISRALSKEDQEIGNTHWSDALSSLGKTKSWAGVNFGNRIVDSRQVAVSSSAARVFRGVQVLGGENGWYYGDFLWKLRGFLDRLVGGPGLRRGRRHPIDVRVGDAIDFWRVESFEPNKKIRLRAEMKVPGRAWLEFSVQSQEQKTLLRQTAIFDPVGLTGRAYWYFLYPIHALIFRGMLQSIANRAEKEVI